MKFVNWFLLILAPIVFVTCKIDEEKAEIIFIGDSIISRWKMNTYFREYKAFNAGKGGSGIDYIESHKGKYKNKTVIIHFGTNDISKIPNLDDYAKRYVHSVESLSASKVILLPIMPRGSKETANALKAMPRIRYLNIEIKAEAHNHGWHYVDVFDELLDESGNYFDIEYTVDGIHPNENGYKFLSVKVKELL